MTPTAPLRTALRILIDEPVPDGGADEDTLFSNPEIDQLLSGADDLYVAAGAGWRLKAGRVVSTSVGELTETAVGAERYRFVDPATRAKLAQDMAEMYDQRSPLGVSTILSVIEPNVLGAGVPLADCDVSRLVVYDACGNWYRYP